MGWMPRRTGRSPGRFDAWQNRPDRPAWRLPRRSTGFVRPALLLVGAFALLAIGHQYGDVLVGAAERIIGHLGVWAGW